MASRALLLPGPMPPLSHFGLTLLRHGVATGLRYAFYHLGLPVPEAAPVKLLRLRLYLERDGLLDLLQEPPGGGEIAACLLDPGGRGLLPSGAARLGSALAFHRLRLRFLHRPRALPPAPLSGSGEPAELWAAFRRELSRLAPRLGDALLAELAAARRRRQARARGREVPPCLSRPAWRFRQGRPVAPGLFGVPDPACPSWAEEPERAIRAREAVVGLPAPPAHPLRGRFRHAFRAALDRLAPLYLALAASAHARGFLDQPRDAFFLPFDVAGDLAAARRPPWLPEAVAKNRREHETAHLTAEPEEVQAGPELSFSTEAGIRPEWGWGELLGMG